MDCSTFFTGGEVGYSGILFSRAQQLTLGELSKSRKNMNSTFIAREKVVLEWVKISASDASTIIVYWWYWYEGSANISDPIATCLVICQNYIT